MQAKEELQERKKEQLLEMSNKLNNSGIIQIASSIFEFILDFLSDYVIFAQQWMMLVNK